MRADAQALVALALFLPAFAMAFDAGLPTQRKLLPPEQAFRLSVRGLDPSTIEARFDVADDDRDRNDFGGVIGMDFAYRRLNVGIQHGSRLDDDGTLVSRFDSAAPVID